MLDTSTDYCKSHGHTWSYKGLEKHFDHEYYDSLRSVAESVGRALDFSASQQAYRDTDVYFCQRCLTKRFFKQNSEQEIRIRD